jgi:hypothetical protein
VRENECQPARSQVSRADVHLQVSRRDLDSVQIRLLFKFTDWLLELPRELEEKFSRELAEFESERKMP